MRLSILYFFLTTILFFFSSPNSHAEPLGGVLTSKKHPNHKIYIECLDPVRVGPCELAILVLESNDKLFRITHRPFSMAQTNDNYQERWGFFIETYTEATLRMPPIPEFRYLWLINSSTKAYKKAFHHLDREEFKNEPLVIRELYFSKLEEVLLEL